MKLYSLPPPPPAPPLLRGHVVRLCPFNPLADHTISRSCSLPGGGFRVPYVSTYKYRTRSVFETPEIESSFPASWATKCRSGLPAGG